MLVLCGNMTTLRAQIADPRDFFPLQIGNTWEYTDGQTGRVFYRITLTGTTVNINGDTLVSYVLRNAGSGSQTTGWYRIDSLNHVYSLLDRDSSNQYLSYKLDAQVGDKWRDRTIDTISWAEVIGINPTSVFGVPATAMKIEYYLKGDGFEQWEQVQTIATGFGMIMNEGHPSAVEYLTGAIINGKHYGKLTLDVSPALTRALTLDCAPNPCAGATIISYCLPTSGPVRLAVSDMLGREVAVLADGDREAGEYRARFDGMGLPNGTYFLHFSRNGSRITRSIQLMR